MTFSWADVTFNEPSDVDAINALGNAMEALHAPWTDYSSAFTITAATTSPTKGNSTYNARYKQVGKSVDYGFSISIGSTFSPGAGIYFFPFPVPVNVASIVTRSGPAVILDNGVQYRTAVLNTYTTTQLAIILPNGNFIDSTGSGTAWAGGDIIKGSISYEAA